MVMAQPHFLLFCDASGKTASETGGERLDSGGLGAAWGRWKFTLEQLDGNRRLEVADCEEHSNPERLALMSVVRGLEALEQPSKVTLVTTSKYVSRGLRYGLSSWRERDYTWERFGVQMPIRNADLWQRVDGAMRFHGVTCRLIQAGACTATGELSAEASRADEELDCVARTRRVPGAQASQPQVAHLDVATRDVVQPVVDRRPAERVSSDGRLIHPVSLIDSWWQLAAAWIRWWRERWQTKEPVLWGT